MYNLSKLPSAILKEIALKAKMLRKQQGVSQLQLSKKSGVSYASIKRFEQTGQISLESLLKLAHVLGRLVDFEIILKPTAADNQKDIESLFSNKTRK